MLVECWKKKKDKILEILFSRKGVFSYEKVVGIESLSLTPEDGMFFKKVDLKFKTV